MNANLQAEALKALIDTLTLRGFAPEAIKAQVDAFNAEVARFSSGN